MSFQIDDLLETSNTHPFQSFSSFQQTNLDNIEIVNIQNQVDSLRTFLESVQYHSDNRKQLYANEISKLQMNINEENRKVRNDLIRQQETQEAEINRILADQENEINEILFGTQAFEYDAMKWNDVSAELTRLCSSIEHTEMQKLINQAQGQSDEIEFSRSVQYEEQRTRNVRSLDIQRCRMQSLQNEIDHYKILIREENKHFSAFLRDFELSQSNGISQQRVLTDKLKLEIQEREKIFNFHLNLIQKQIKEEKESADHDILSLKDTEESLIQLQQRTSQKCVQQLSETTNEINTIQQTLHMLNPSDEANKDSPSGSFPKIQNLKKENLHLSMSLDKVVAEIEKVKKNIQIGKSELNKNGAPRRNATQGYSRRSVFF